MSKINYDAKKNLEEFIVKINNVLILGSAPNAVLARNWNVEQFSSLVVINNAWQIRSEWTHNIFPSDFPIQKRPKPTIKQHLISAKNYVPIQNDFGGFVYAGGTMAITASYWALAILKPTNLYFLGCDMVYGSGKTHFYGRGTPDPLRKDISLRSLEAKSSRFECFASMAQCSVFNLSEEKRSRLVYRRKKISEVKLDSNETPRKIDKKKFAKAIALENKLNYFVADGKYWKHEASFDSKQIDKLDRIWLKCLTN